MSRRPQQQSMDSSHVDPPEEEDVLSGPGEGDEVMEEAEEQEGYTSSTPTSSLTWVSWFCSLPGHDYFCEVAEDFIEDDFNLTGLNVMVPFWKEAMEMVLDVEPDEDLNRVPDVSIVEASAELLYGLVHQRYILTRAGLQAMADKYEAGIFGSCPRVYCTGTNVVPCGRSDHPGNDTVKLYCPNCNDIYVPPSSRFQGVDGAFFGTTFAHLFFQTYRELMPAPFWKPQSASGSLSPSRSPRSGTGSTSTTGPPFVNPNQHGGQKRAAGKVYVPRIYGFRVSEKAKSGPRMQWMRLRPESPDELEYVDWRGRWIDDEDEFDDEEDGEAEEDRQMEDFDPERADGDVDDDEEEEEEEEVVVQSARGGRRFGGQEPPVQAAPLSAYIRQQPPISAELAARLVNPGSRVKVTQATARRVTQNHLAYKQRRRSSRLNKTMVRNDTRRGVSAGHPTTAIPKVQRPSQRKGIQSTKTKFVRSVVREVVGFSPYERRVMELLRNSKDKKARKLTKKRLGTLLRSKRKLEELSNVIQESRRAH
ncbi:hypothetical protein FA95DRAFT_1601368 [Auriscalpium vulgare]|uniref:Uncharacterized protein n=1 Tax=Auriscalpium vulgare TaxID=40419 RepID=A0ACB8SAN6_9AGAM|nr:hypothetical protein FA95DRAFT_1601368 [Auriscalpium vulgare]